ncbi:MAG: phosphatase PAP2 family protein [Bacillota bacterium]
MEKKKINKNSLILLISLLGSFVALMLVGTFLDLQINIYLQNPQSVFGQFLEYLGEFPGYMSAAVAFVILFQAITKENKFYLALKILTGTLAFVGIYIFIQYLMKKFFNPEIDYKLIYQIFFTILASVLAYLCTYKIDKDFMKKLSYFAIGLLLVLAISQVIVTISKDLWGRLRFRNMDMNTYEGYSPWYKIHFGTEGREQYVVPYSSQFPYHPEHHDSDAFRSMPSGHTAAAGITLILIMLPDLFDKLKKYKVWFYVIPIVYTSLVAISRIIVMAHFLTDVVMATAIVFASVFFSRWFILFVRQKIIDKKLQKV